MGREWRIVGQRALVVVALWTGAARADAPVATDAPSEATISEIVRILSYLSDTHEHRRLQGQLRETLSNRRFAFCRSPSYPLNPEDAGLCFLASDLAGTCGAFQRACASYCEKDPTACTREHVPVTPPRPERAARMPAGLVRVARSSFWVSLLFVTIALLVFVGKHTRAWRLATHEDEPRRSARPVRALQAPIRRRAQPSDLRLADEASRRGDHETAMMLALRGAYHALGRAGRIRPRPSGTNGDYLEDVRADAEIHSALTEAVDAVESVQFGAAPATASSYAALRRSVARISSQLATGVSAVLMCFLGLGCNELGGRAAVDVAAQPAGTALLRELVEGRGGRFHHRVRSVVELDEGVSAVIVHPRAQLTATQWQTLMTWTARGRLLVLAAPPRETPALLEIGAARAPCPTAPRSVTDALLESKVRLAARGATLELHGSSWMPLAVCGEHATVAWREFGSGRVVALGSEEMLTNASLAAADNGRFLLSWLGPARVVHFVDDLTGAGSQSPYVAVANAGLVPVVAQLLLAALILIVARTRGKPPSIAPLPHAPPQFSEHVVAMGRLHHEAGNAAFALTSYRRWAIARLSTRLRAHGLESPERLSRAIARKTDRDPRDVRDLLFGRSDADGVSPSDPLDDLHALQTLVSEVAPQST